MEGKKIVLYTALFLAASYFFFVGLVLAEPFLVPLLTALVLALLMFPITNKLEQWGWNKILATTASTILLLLVTLGFVVLLIVQIKAFADDWDMMQSKLEDKFEELSDWLIVTTPIEQEQLERVNPLNGDDTAEGTQGSEENEEKEQEEAEEEREQAVSALEAFMGFFVDFLITFVYVFFLIHYRSRFKEFFLRFFPLHRRPKVAEVIHQSSFVSRNYLAGRILLGIILTVLYSIGLLISGMENAILIALLAAALSIIPFIGNVIGYAIAIAVSLLTNGDTAALAIITVTFLVAQFIDSYILQPIVLGDKLNVHPFFIILSVVMGNAVWGVMGMVLSIPLFAIVAVICRHVPELNPFGYLFSNNDIDEPVRGKMPDDISRDDNLS
jgi:predicted PurR-regulated permease PerM